MNEVYPLKLVMRLLDSWPELAAGVYPRQPGNPEGYRGKHPLPAGGFELAVEAAVDIEQAVDRLPEYVAIQVRRRFLECNKRAPDEMGSSALVYLVYGAINRV